MSANIEIKKSQEPQNKKSLQKKLREAEKKVTEQVQNPKKK